MTQLTLIHSAEPIVEASRVPDDFDIFWTLCPRKVGKGKAREAFVKALREGADSEDIIDGMKAYRQHLRDHPPEDIKYVPHPTTWLNQERWADNHELDLGLTDEERAEERARLNHRLRQLNERAERNGGVWDDWGRNTAADIKRQLSELE